MIQPSLVTRLCLLVNIFGVMSLVILGLPGIVRAHELNEDQSISAVMHIIPDDNPVADRQTQINFEFKNENPGFDLATCRCQIAVKGSTGSPVISLISHLQNSKTSGQATVKFMTPGATNIAVSGYGSAEHVSKFHLNYDISVRPVTTTAAPVNHAETYGVISISAASLLLLAIIAAYLIGNGKRYR